MAATKPLLFCCAARLMCYTAEVGTAEARVSLPTSQLIHNHMNLSALKQQLVPAILKFQEFRDSLPDEEWDELMDDWNTELLLDSLTEIEDVLIQADLVE